MKHRAEALGLVFSLAFSLLPGMAMGQAPAVSSSQESRWVTLVTPAENSLVISRKPPIKGKFLRKIQPGSVVLVVDGTDYTGLAAITASDFAVTPPLPIPPGNHEVSVHALDEGGQPLEYTAVFSSKHSEWFDEIASNNDLTGTYEVAIHKPSTQETSINNASEEANLTTTSMLRKGPWKLSLDANARFKDQSLPIQEPERRGFDIVSYTFRGGYEKDTVRGEVAVGDVRTEETPYTLANLGRKGATFVGDAGPVSVHAFTLQSEDIYGTRGGLSLDGGTEDHIRGGSAAFRLFENKIELKAVYIDGGERQGSYSITTSEGAREGSVLGFQLTTDFFAGKFRTDMEADFSEFNADTSSPDGSFRKDHAFRVGGTGAAGIYEYGALFEYVGRDYEVIGNQGLAKDRVGGMVQGSINLETQSIGVNVFRYNDNVKDDPLFAVNTNWQAGLTYSLNRWPSLPISLTYQYERQESTKEPAGSIPLDLQTNSVTGQVTYGAGAVNTTLSGGYTKTDDRSEENADSWAWNVRLAPSWNIAVLSVTPSFAYNKAKALNVRTDTLTIGLDGNARFFENRVTADIGSTYTIVKTTDQTQDNRDITGNFRIGYNLPPLLSGRFRLTTALTGNYHRIKDQITPSADLDEWTLFLTFTAHMPIVL